MPIDNLPLVANDYVATRIADKGEVTTIINSGPSTIYIGTNATVRSSDLIAIPIVANVFFTWDGRSDLYASLPSGTSNIYKLPGIINMGML